MDKNWCYISKLVNSWGGCLHHAKTSIDEFSITGDKLALLEKKNKVSLYVYQLRQSKAGVYVARCHKGNKEFRNIMCKLLMIKIFDGYFRTIMNKQGYVKKYCHSCLMKLHTQEELVINEDGCKINQTLVFPPQESTLHFKNYSYAHSS